MGRIEIIICAVYFFIDNIRHVHLIFRVVNVSSVAGMLKRLGNVEMKKKLAGNEYSIPELEQIANQYIE